MVNQVKFKQTHFFLVQYVSGETLSLASLNVSLFASELEHSYSCNSVVKTNLTEVRTHAGDKRTKSNQFLSGTVETSHARIQSFMPQNKKIDQFMQGKGY